uniref:Uncharacterized protein n=1 Tax=Oryza brachyantha TaxID=4533 RepID=J3MUV2_ORYBR
MMESTVLSLGKSVLNGAVGYAQSAVAEEVALQLGIQRDHVFIRDELEMMRSFLMAADEERDERRVAKTWVKQLRDLAYDVEDCLQDMAVRSSRWRHCSPRALLERRRVAEKMKELRAKVEDVSQRSVRYRLIDASASKVAADAAVHPTVAGAGATTMSETEETRRQQDRAKMELIATTMSETEETRRQQDRAKMELTRLINASDDNPGVIAVWGSSSPSALGYDGSIVRRAYEDLRMNNKFECCAWIKLMSPFNQSEFLYGIIRQFYVNSLQRSAEAKQVAAGLVDQIPRKKGGDALVDAFKGSMNDKGFLIVVITNISTAEEWGEMKKCLPSNDTRSRLVVCTEHIEVARLCAHREGTPPELKKLSDAPVLYAFYGAGGSAFDQNSQGRTNSAGPSSSSHHTTTSGNNSSMDSTKLTDVETMVATLEESQLIGRVKEKSDIMKLITNQASHQRSHVVSIWGMGGLGKTTLVQDIYRSPEIGRIFDKRACITVMRPFNSGKLVESIAKQFGDENEKDLAKLLEGSKRYLVVLDDLWSTKEWDDMMLCLPSPSTVARCIIVTTREENIAMHCSEERNIYKLSGLKHDQARHLFTKKVFKEKTNLDEQYPELVEQANLILKKCDGLPLAIVTIGGFLASQPKTVSIWRKLNEHISADLEMNPKLKMIKAILVRSFDGLPYHLKACFLYLSIFPEDHKISRKRLMQRWVAEGYTWEAHGKPAEETSHDIFKELISRSMILPAQQSIRRGGEIIGYCQLHDLMREISITKSVEENLVFRLEEGCSSRSQGTTRHLAISSNWKGDKHDFESMVDLPRVRSVTVFGRWKPFFISEKMRMLRVLDLEDTTDVAAHHLEHIGKLIHLKYISLRGCFNICHLPDSLCELRQLETLDIRCTRIAILPKTIVKLRKLKYLHASVPIPPRVIVMDLDTSCPTLPRGSRKLKGLHSLRHVHLAWGNVVIKEIEKLTQLRKLGVTGINRKNGPAFCSAISKLGRLESLSVLGSFDLSLRGCLEYRGTSSTSPSPPENLQSLRLIGQLGKLSQWIGKLQNLMKLRLEETALEDADAAIQVLGALPSLAILRLQDGWFKGGVRLNFRQEEATAILFPSLRVLDLHFVPGSRSGLLESVQFGGGATPKLEQLRFTYKPDLCDIGLLSGLEELQSLEEFMLSGTYNSRMHKDRFVEDVQKQLANHPNTIMRDFCRPISKDTYNFNINF